MNQTDSTLIIATAIFLPIFWIIISLLAHEFAHVVMGWITGCPVKEFRVGIGYPPKIKFKIKNTKFIVTPWIAIAGVLIDHRHVTPTKRIYIYLAGPLTNLVIGILTLLITNTSIDTIWKMITYDNVYLDSLISASTGEIWAIFGVINVLIAIFNLLPIYLLDGGRVVYELIESSKLNFKTKEKILNSFVAADLPSLYGMYAIVICYLTYIVFHY